MISMLGGLLGAVLACLIVNGEKLAWRWIHSLCSASASAMPLSASASARSSADRPASFRPIMASRLKIVDALRRVALSNCMGLITNYNLRSMIVRKGTATMTAMGIAMVVAVSS